MRWTSKQSNWYGLQTTFRTRLIARDFNCLVTDTEFDECIAAHILPYSRTDVSISQIYNLGYFSGG